MWVWCQYHQPKWLCQISFPISPCAVGGRYLSDLNCNPFDGFGEITGKLDKRSVYLKTFSVSFLGVRLKPKRKLRTKFNLNPISSFSNTIGNHDKNLFFVLWSRTRLNFSKLFLSKHIGLKRKLCTRLQRNPFVVLEEINVKLYKNRI